MLTTTGGARRNSPRSRLGAVPLAAISKRSARRRARAMRVELHCQPHARSNRHRTGPYFSQQLVADRYPDAVKKEFKRSVDSLRWGQQVRDPAAMDLITLDEVKEKVDTALASDYAHPQSRQPLTVV